MKLVPVAVSSKFGRQLLHIEKASPNILFGVGIVGFVGTVVLASRATLNLDAVIEVTQKDIGRVNDNAELTDENGKIVYTAEDAQHDKMVVYARAARDITKLYGPAVIVGVVSIACLTKSHHILTKRNAALTAAYAAIEKAFAEYRGRVRDAYGEERERELYYPLEKCEIDEEENSGKKKKESIVTGRKASIYARFFDSTNQNYNPIPEYNIAFLRSQQNYANDKLRARGHLLLNDVYDLLGMERTTPGAVVGWLWQKGGDNYVDFGIFNQAMQPEHYDFFRGLEDSILLDFNVDGIIYDKLDSLQNPRKS